jgi:hypothetical protein
MDGTIQRESEAEIGQKEVRSDLRKGRRMRRV